jgi:hypothetical protein
MDYKNYIYSKTHDYYLVLPMKTGSRTASWIFTYFDFVVYTRNFIDDTQFIEFPNPSMSHIHSYYLPPEIENHKIIVTARNPYEKTLSRFLHGWIKNSTPTPLDFENYIISSSKNPNESVTFPDDIYPNYVIHLETLFEDYMKIPFVSDSNLVKSGILQEILEKKINKARINVDKEKFLTDTNKEIIYSFTKNQFELFGYQK